MRLGWNKTHPPFHSALNSLNKTQHNQSDLKQQIRPEGQKALKMGSFYHKVSHLGPPPLFAFIFTQPKWSKELLGVMTGPNIYKVQFKKSGWHSILLAKTLFIHSQSQFELLLSNIWSKCHGCSSISTPNFNPSNLILKDVLKIVLLSPWKR